MQMTSPRLIQLRGLGAIACATVALTMGCTDKKKPELSPGPTRQAAFAPAPQGTPTVRELSGRYRGQSEFLSPAERSVMPFAAAAAPQAGARSGGGQRAIQEADLFKVGAGGLLYLLNDYRGLQIVSFAAGPDKPALLSRVPATGNYPKDMYYVENGGTKRLVVLETFWVSGDYTSEEQSRALVYDATQPSRPTVAQEVAVKGQIADSRLVGDILYIASSVRPWSRYGDRTAASGYVTSFRVKDGKLEKVQEYKLQQAVQNGELMGIAETRKDDGSFNYYLVSVLSDTGWNWGGRESMVEVVDISDPTGTVKPVMTVGARGAISRRSEVMVLGRTLVVASNFSVDKTDWRSPMHVSVETFNFPRENSEILSTLQADYRKIRIEAALEGKTGQEARDLRARLEADADLGVKGRFVRSGEQLRKLVADSSAATRDDENPNGSAELQDVRYQDGLIYAFWVPRSKVDPLDVFAIPDPEKGVTYLNRLKFDGWIERAEPFMVGGQRFLVGLGWAIPASEEQDGRRRPQAAIFKVSPQGTSWRTSQIAQMTLDSGDIWTNFQAADKYVEIRETAPGVGQALFSAYRWNAGLSGQDGGKIVFFDINKANSGADGALTEGPFMVGDSGWVRRVFTNPEIDRVNVFSNQALGVFKPEQGPAISAATATLELARNIRAYAEIPGTGSERVGVQIISDYSYYSSASRPASTEVRLVPRTAPDAELSNAIGSVPLQGQYVGHVVDGTGALYVLSSETHVTPIAGRGYQYDTTARLARVIGTRAVVSASWSISRTAQGGGRGFGFRLGYGFGANRDARLLALPDGSILAQTDGSIQIARFSGGTLSLQPVSVDETSCHVAGRDSVSVRRSDDGAFFVVSEETKKFTEFPEAEFTKTYVATASIGAGKLSCNTEFNIPGDPISVSATGAITNDSYAKDLTLKTVEFQRRTDDGKVETARETRTEILRGTQLASVTFRDGRATLVDGSEGANASFTAIGGGLMASIRSEDNNRYGGFGSSDDNQETPLAFDFVRQGPGGLLLTRSFRVFGKVGSYPAIAGLWTEASGGALAVVTGSQRAQAIRWNDLDKGGRPEIVPVQTMDQDGVFGPAADAARLPGYFWFGGQTANRSQDGAISFSLGLAGVLQMKLAN